MNYRHHFHAGNFADVMKHIIVAELCRSMQEKLKGVLFLDTHSGRGAYDLTVASTGDTLARKPEHPDGIGRLWNQTKLPEAITQYLSFVKAFDLERGGTSQAGPIHYPGSPTFLIGLARVQDRVALCEKHHEECDILKIHCSRPSNGTRVTIQALDGYTAIKAMLPPPERRALILIDPPYELENEVSNIAEAITQGLKRFPSGVFALWYPITERMRIDELNEKLRLLKLPPTLIAEITVDPMQQGLKGCGMLIINPPWHFDKKANEIMQALLPLLKRSSLASTEVDWLVPETT